MEPPAFQDYFRDNYCFGCGALNERGLQIKSRWEGEEAVCTWRAAPYHSAGSPHILSGGIIAALLDCHSMATAIADAYRREGREMDSEPEIVYVTGSLHLNFVRPTPLSQPVTLRAHVKARAGRRTTIVATLYSEEQECVRAEAVAVRVSESWRRDQAPER